MKSVYDEIYKVAQPYPSHNWRPQEAVPLRLALYRAQRQLRTIMVDALQLTIDELDP